MTQNIVTKTCKQWGVSYEDVISPSRRQHIVFARVMIAKFLRQFEKLSYKKIGGIINRNHSCVIRYMGIFDSECRFNDTFRNFAKSIEADLENDNKDAFALEIEAEFNEIVN